MTWAEDFLERWVYSEPALRKLYGDVTDGVAAPPDLVLRYTLLWCFPLLDQLPTNTERTSDWLRAQLGMALATRYTDDVWDHEEGAVFRARQMLNTCHTLVSDSLLGMSLDTRTLIRDATLTARRGAASGDIDARCAQVLAIPLAAPGDLDRSGLRQLLRILTIDDDAEDVTTDYPTRLTWAVEVALAEGGPPVGAIRQKVLDSGLRRLDAEFRCLSKEAVWVNRILDHHVSEDLLFLPALARGAVDSNVLDGLAELLASWEAPSHPANAQTVPLLAGSSGNISQTGLPGCIEGPVLSRWHPQFNDAVEPGVRLLVEFVVRVLNLVTYTSCEGHRPTAPTQKPSERMVGILPRSKVEHEKAVNLFDSEAPVFHQICVSSPINVVANSRTLLADGHPIPVLDLSFSRRSGHSWFSYFGALDGVYQAVLHALGEAVGSG